MTKEEAIKYLIQPVSTSTVMGEETAKQFEAYRMAVEALRQEPMAHAHWTIIYESTAGVTDARCSNCGYESLAYENDVHTDENCNYCPCCGAKMDEEV